MTDAGRCCLEARLSDKPLSQPVHQCAVGPTIRSVPGLSSWWESASRKSNERRFSPTVRREPRLRDFSRQPQPEGAVRPNGALGARSPRWGAACC
jgi:hypothetical protein